MEEQKATEVGCQACKKSPKILAYEKGVFIFGGVLFFLALYGVISVVSDIVSLF